MRARLPDTPPETRTDLHRGAVDVISPARAAVNGQITLRATPGGFATPPYGDVDAPLQVDTPATEALADWFALPFDVLGEFRDLREARRRRLGR
jgi:hypothetical protein